MTGWPDPVIGPLGLSHLVGGGAFESLRAVDGERERTQPATWLKAPPPGTINTNDIHRAEFVLLNVLLAAATSHLVAQGMAMKRIVRRYEPEDLDDVLSSWESATRVAHPFLTEQFLEQERHNIPNVYLPNAETWVVEQGNRVIGFISLIGSEVGAVFVRPEFHGTGAGRSLMDKAQELRGDLEVEVFKANGIAREFYESYGFKHLTETIHEETGNELIRLKFTAGKKVEA